MTFIGAARPLRSDGLAARQSMSGSSPPYCGRWSWSRRPGAVVIKGFNPGDTDGRVGPRTRAAIAAFVNTRGGLPTDAVDTGLLAALVASGDNGARSGP